MVTRSIRCQNMNFSFLKLYIVQLNRPPKFIKSWFYLQQNGSEGDSHEVLLKNCNLSVLKHDSDLPQNWCGFFFLCICSDYIINYRRFVVCCVISTTSCKLQNIYSVAHRLTLACMFNDGVTVQTRAWQLVQESQRHFSLMSNTVTGLLDCCNQCRQFILSVLKLQVLKKEYFITECTAESDIKMKWQTTYIPFSIVPSHMPKISQTCIGLQLHE